jgi:hypothetical protein
LNGLLFRLLVLVLSPPMVWVVLVASSRIEALLSDSRPVIHAAGDADARPPAPQVLPAAGEGPYLPSLIPFAEWRQDRPLPDSPSKREEARGLGALAPNRKEAAIWPRDPAPPVSQ